jgi:O-antigen/teichoic acid export membrane protein
VLRKIFAHSFIYGMAPHVPKIASIFIYPLLTAHLTEVDYGVFGVVATYTAALIVLQHLGLRLLLVNSFYHNRNHFIWRWRFVYGVLRIWQIIFGILLAGVLFLIIPFEAKDNTLLIITLTVIPMLIFGPVNMFMSTYYQLKQKPLPIGIRSVIFGFLTVGANYITIVEYEMGYMGWFFSLFVVEVLTSLSYLIPFKYSLKIKPIYAYKPKLLKKYLKISLPVIPHFYSSYLLNSSDRIVMDNLKVSTSNIGDYSFAYTFGNYFNMLTQAITMAMAPMLNEEIKANRERRFRSIIFSVQLFVFSLTFSVSVWCKEIFEILVKNDSLKLLYPLAIVIIMSYNYRPAYNGVMNRLFYHEKTTSLWKISLIAGVINVLLNILLIPYYGYEVAAYTTYVALLYMGYSGYFLPMYKEIKTDVKYYPVLWMISQIGITIVAVLIMDSNYLIKFGASLIIWIPTFYWVYKNKVALLKDQSQ